MSSNVQIIITMAAYIAVIIGISFYYMKRSNENTENYYLGGRGLGTWVTAMSAEASDMSGWLLMGLPGVAYWYGVSDAAWTAIGLALGTYLNWLIVSKRLRRYSVVAGNSITLPDFFNNRFKDDKKIILFIAAIFILVFFAVYAGSCFVVGGKLFNTLFGLDYKMMMIISAVFVIIYTLIGGFLAESLSDMVQGFIMFAMLIIVLVAGVVAAGGPTAIIENLKDIPGFTEFFGIASPVMDDVSGLQAIENNAPVFGPAGAYGVLTIISTMAWGLGYFGMPQVLLRFMAIRKINELKRSRRIAVVWVVISLAAAVIIGLVGRALYPVAHGTSSAAENIFISTAVDLLPPVIAGLAMAGILAASMSSSDSYLLIATSAVSKNLLQGIFKKDATDRQIMVAGRITLLILAVVGILIALDENSVIFKIVSFAWAGFGATFGPLMLFSLFWKRTTKTGAIAGMLIGAATVFIWKLAVRPFAVAHDLPALNIYELLPAFIISCIAIVIFSLATKAPSQEIQDEFEIAKDNSVVLDAEESMAQ